MQRGLSEIPGVLEATLEWEKGRAEVTYDPSMTAPVAMTKAKIFTQEWVAETDSKVVRHQYGATLNVAGD